MNLIEKCWEAIVTWFKRVWRLLQLNWDLFGGIISGAILSWLSEFDNNKISTIYAVIILILVCIGLFKVLKNSVDKRVRRKKVAIDTVVDQQRPKKAIAIATGNPTKSGEELGKIIIETAKGWKKSMQKIKNFFVWIGKYWQQIIGISCSLSEYAIYVWFLLSDKLQPVFALLPEGAGWQIGAKVLLSVLVALIVILQIRNMCKWVGLGSLEKANEYLASKVEETKSKLSGNSKKAVERQVKVLKLNAKTLEKAIKEFESSISKVEKEIETAKELLSLGLGDPVRFNDLEQSRRKLLNDKELKKNQLTSIQANIEKYSKVL